MVIAATITPNHKTTPFNPRRLPLFPSEKLADINNSNNAGIPRRLKSRDVTSRYLSTSSSSSTSFSSSSSTSSRRCPSPSTVRDSPANKRAVSVDRRRPTTPKSEMSSAAKLLMSSMRSLSVSFQGGSFSVPSPKARVVKSPAGNSKSQLPAGTSSVRRGENSRPSDQPWPGRVVSMSRSVDLGRERKSLVSVGSDKVVRPLKQSLITDQIANRTDIESSALRNSVRISDQTVDRPGLESSTLRKNVDKEAVVSNRTEDRTGIKSSTLRQSVDSESSISEQIANRMSFKTSALRRSVNKESVMSDTESVSSESNSGSSGVSRGRGGGRSMIVPPRNWPESKGRLEPSSPLARTSSLPVPSKITAPKKFVSDCSVGSPKRPMSSRGLTSPIRGSARPASPSKMGLSSIRGLPSANGENVRSASPSKMGSSSSRGLSSTNGGNVRPASPSKMGSSSSRGLSSANGGNLRPASPSKVGLSSPHCGYVRPASPSRMGLSGSRGLSSPMHGTVRPGSPSKTGLPSSRELSSPLRGNVRPASPSKMGLSSSRGLSSPLCGNVRQASPSKMGSLDRSSNSIVMGRMASPSRVRSAVSSTPSVLCYGVNVRTVKVGDNRLGDAHLLRLLYNRHLQLRFVNAKAEDSLSIQHFKTERSLYNAWKATSDLCGAVSCKRQELQWLRLKLKLVSTLKCQILHLEEWSLIEKDHCTSLSGATESLEASTLRLPLIGGARVDVQDLKDAVCSAADVMHLMASSICALSRKVEEMNSLVAELASLTAKERIFLNKCKDTLSTLAAMQVKDYSLRANILQIKCALSSLAGQV